MKYVFFKKKQRNSNFSCFLFVAHTLIFVILAYFKAQLRLINDIVEFFAENDIFSVRALSAYFDTLTLLATNFLCWKPSVPDERTLKAANIVLLDLKKNNEASFSGVQDENNVKRRTNDGQQTKRAKWLDAILSPIRRNNNALKRENMQKSSQVVAASDAAAAEEVDDEVVDGEREHSKSLTNSSTEELENNENGESAAASAESTRVSSATPAEQQELGFEYTFALHLFKLQASVLSAHQSGKLSASAWRSMYAPRIKIEV